MTMNRTSELVMFLAGLIMCSASASTVIKDPGLTVSSVMVNDFSETENMYTNLSGMVLDSVADGVGNFIYPADAGSEGYGSFNSMETYDSQYYNRVRLRMYTTWNEFGTTNKAIEVYPYPVVDGAGRVTLNINSRTSFYEVSYDFSGAIPSVPFNGEGVRIDPFNYANDATADTWTVDYIMADAVYIRGAEFDSQGDLARYPLVGITNATIVDSVLSATSTTADPQVILHSGMGINADSFDYVEIRAKVTAGGEIKWYWKTDSTGYMGVTLSSGASNDGEWHTYLVDMTDEPGWAGGVTYNRFDPTHRSGDAFALDYFRFLSELPPDPLFGYEKWAGRWGVDIGSETADYDEDGLSNLYEFGLDGDPTDPVDQGVSPEFAVAEIGGSNEFVYVHSQRSDPDSGLIYSLALATDLVSGNWVTNTGYVIDGTNVTGGTLDFVTNTTDMIDDQKYIRLIIE